MNKVCDGVWELTQKLPIGGGLPCRMSIVRASDGSIVLYSPLKLSRTIAKDIEGLGKVSAIVAPNAYHHLFADEAKQQFPDATLYASPGILSRKKKISPDETLVDGEIAPGVFVIELRGSRTLQEFVMYCDSSKALFLSDAFVNMKKPKKLFAKVVAWLMGPRGTPVEPRFLRLMLKNVPQAKESMRQVLEFPFEVVVPAHGAVIDHDARNVFVSGLRATRP